MNTESNAMARPSPQQEADTALQPIRGMVAATTGHLSAHAPSITRHHAEQRQDRAMEVADGVLQEVPAAA